MVRTAPIFYAVCLCAGWLLTGCQTPTPVVTPTAAPAAVHTTLIPTRAPTPAPTAAASPTPQPGPTAVRARTDALRNARLSAAGHLPDWRYFFAVEADEEITGQYAAVVDNSKAYDCRVYPAAPRRLYCSGPLAAYEDWVPFDIYDQQTQQIVFSGRVYCPALP